MFFFVFCLFFSCLLCRSFQWNDNGYNSYLKIDILHAGKTMWKYSRSVNRKTTLCVCVCVATTEERTNRLNMANDIITRKLVFISIQFIVNNLLSFEFVQFCIVHNLIDTQIFVLELKINFAAWCNVLRETKKSLEFNLLYFNLTWKTT